MSCSIGNNSIPQFNEHLVNFENAIKEGNLSELKKSLVYVDPSILDNAAIKGAVAFRHIELVKELLADNPSADSNCAVRLAVQVECLDILNLLLADNRVDPSANNNEALGYAKLGRNPIWHEIRAALRKDKRVSDLEKSEV